MLPGTGPDELAARIRAEMLAEYSDALERNFELAKQVMKVTDEGKVEVLAKDQLTAEESVACYLVGKLYAERAGLAPGPGVSNVELAEELGLPMGTVLPTLKTLRDKGLVERIKNSPPVEHAVQRRAVERILKQVADKATAS